MSKPNIHGGLYLVVDPYPGQEHVLPRLKEAIEGGVDVIQLWNHWHPQQDQQSFINAALSLAQPTGVPVLIHEAWQWLQTTALNGVHFDSIPADWPEMQKIIDRPFITGITCGNDSARIDWAIHHADYISFCSMFPSSSANSCEIVSPYIVEQTRSRTSMPIFAAGGITTENVPGLLLLGIDGVAVISAIMKADDPKEATQNFKHRLEKNLY